MPAIEENAAQEFQDFKAVVSLLDETHSHRVRYLWDELETRFGVEHIFRTPVPHFSYHVAKDYNLSHIERILSEAACEQSPFSITTSGLGIFTGARPTLYVPVIRTAALSAFHERIYPALAQTSTHSRFSTTPLHWAPHITLALAEIAPKTLAEIIQHFSRRDFTWEIVVDNVALICDTCGEQGIEMCFDFGGTPTNL